MFQLDCFYWSVSGWRTSHQVTKVYHLQSHHNFNWNRVFTWQFWSGQCLRQLRMVHVRAPIQTKKERHIIFTPSYRCEYWKVFSEPYVLRVTFFVRKLLLNNNNNNVNWICIALFKVLHIKSIINLCHIWHTSGDKLHVHPQLPWDSLAKAWLPISAKQPLGGHTTEH